MFRYAYLYNELKIEDCFDSLDPAERIDTSGDIVSGPGYKNILGEDAEAYGAAALIAYSPAPDTTIKEFLESHTSLYNPSGGSYTSQPYNYKVPRDTFANFLTDAGLDLEKVLYKNWAAKTKTYLYDGYGNDFEAVLSEPAANRFATNAQIKSANKYLADYNFTIAPSVKIIEIPVATKTIRIMDHPPVAPDVTPYQRKDDSQIVGFYVRTESFHLPTDPTDTTTMSSFGFYPTALNNDEIFKR